MSTFDLEEREVIESAARAWWLFLLTGLLWLLFAIIVLRFDYTTVTAVSILFGVVAIAAGINEFFMLAASHRWWKVLHGLLGVIFVVVGIIAFVHPGDTFAALAAVISFFLIFKGFFDIIVSIATRDEIHIWWVQLIAGIAEVLDRVLGGRLLGPQRDPARHLGRRDRAHAWDHRGHLRVQAPLRREGGTRRRTGHARSRVAPSSEGAAATRGRPRRRAPAEEPSRAARASATIARRVRVTSMATICSDAVTGTATSAPSTPSSAPKIVTPRITKNGEMFTAFP